MRTHFLVLLVSLCALSAEGAEVDITAAQKAQVELLRTQYAGQIQMRAFDLLDELVYEWNQNPVFATETVVILADVSVPVGFGSGLQALLENHFTSLVTKNPRSRIQLSYCPQCTAVVVHSGARATVVSRGVDQPEALFQAGVVTGSKHALFLDFEAEGSSLVLRARITSLQSHLPIVYGKTLSTSTSTAALLRSGQSLKSAEEARTEYYETLAGRGVWVVPVRFGVRTYAPPADSSGGIATLPLVWLQVGAEVGLTQARAWTAGVTLGGTWLPEVQTGWLLQARFSRLLTGSSMSLVNPDVYGFLGGSLISLHGPGALVFRSGTPTTGDLLLTAAGVSGGDTIFPALQAGFEMRVKNRIAVAVFAESAPTLNDALAIGNYLDVGILRVHTVGAEVSLCF